jgi:hypothetical protein
MLGLPLHATWKILIAAIAGCVLAICLWVYLLYGFGLEAYERGAELPTSKATLVAAIPAGFALVYIGYVLLRHSHMVQAALREWLRNGRLFRFDTRKRLLRGFEKAIQAAESCEQRRHAMKAAIQRHPGWLWGGKPALLGVLAVIAASPLLLASPVIADVVGADIPLAGLLWLAALVWASASLAYLVARWTGYLDERDRTPNRRAAAIDSKPRISELFGACIDASPQPCVQDRVRDLLARASADFESRQDESALQLYRQALRTAMGAFQQKQEGELLRLGLIAYRGVAVSALVTGRHGEAAIAIETGLATATVGLRHWPDAPPLLEEQSQLSALKEKTGLSGAVYIPEDFSEWVADDVRAD